jgi:transcriptional regulator with XRE-family HTH domain
MVDSLQRGRVELRVRWDGGAKGRKSRRVPITPKLAAALKRYEAGHRPDTTFPHLLINEYSRPYEVGGIDSMEGDNEFGLWLRKRRLERKLTQGQLGDLADLSRRWLVEIEAGRAEPTFSAGLRLIDALDADVTDVPGLSRYRSRARPSAAKLASEADTNRRELLQGVLAALTGADLIDLERLASIVSASQPDAITVREAEAVTALLKAQWYTMRPAALLPSASTHLAALKSRLPGSRDLCSVAGWTALLAGALLGKVHRRGDAYSQYALAEALAREAGDSALLATVLVKRRGLVYWRRGGNGDPHRALDLLGQAEATVGPAAPPLLRTVILATRAEDRATVGDETGCLRDLEAAEAALQPSADHSFGPRAPAELGAVRGACESLLGRHQDAVETFDWALREMDPAFAAWRATVAADREAALAAG